MGFLKQSLEDCRLVFILGPTACGKSALSLDWAERHSAGILNCDSIKGYKDLKIGSNRPDFTKYPRAHPFLFAEIKAPKLWTAGDFRKKALKVLNTRWTKKKILAVGGSGFYIQALEKGMFLAPPLKPEIIDKYQKMEKAKGLSALYRLLWEKDPKRASQISSKDSYRLIRSLGLIESQGKPYSKIQREFLPRSLPFPYIKLGLDLQREELFQRVKSRTQKMIKKGLLDEVSALVERGLEDWRPLKSVGYKQALLCLQGKIKREDLEEAIINASMSLAKRQRTWFKRDEKIQWLKSPAQALKIREEIFKG